MLRIFVLYFLIFLCGCLSYVPPPIENDTIDIQQVYCDTNSLKTTDKTYRISCSQNIKVYDKSIETQYIFSVDNYIVHRDFIKTFNENQDRILSLTKKMDKDKWFNVCQVVVVILCIIILVRIL